MIRTLLIAGIVLAGLVVTPGTARAANEIEGLGLWPRGDMAYLTAGQAMPLWPQLPASVNQQEQDLVLTLRLPAGFSVEAVGKSTAFAVLPKPLVVPADVEQAPAGGEEHAVYRFEIPASALPGSRSAGRLALMVDPGDHQPGEYTGTLTLHRAGSDEPLAESAYRLIVLEPLDGERPRRINVGVYNYDGLTDGDYIRAQDEAVVRSGINTIWDMRAAMPGQTEDGTLLGMAPRLADRGVGAGVLWFWKRGSQAIRDKWPEAQRVGPDGKPDGDIATTWIIENREQVMPLVIESVREALEGGPYHTLVLDHEVRAITRDGKTAGGDLYNPGVLERFAEFADISEPIPADAEQLAAQFGDAWVDYRCWQSTQLSSMVAEAVAAVDPILGYGYYSGYQYAPPLEGFTRRQYSTDWELLARDGGIHFGSAGYYGSPADLRSTAQAMQPVPYTPACMYVQNFLDTIHTMPEPDAFAYRLMAAVMDGGARGGVNVWYLSVLDAGGYAAISRVSRVLARIEPILLDGERVDDQLNLPRQIDPADVFVYRLGERRCVVVLNRSAQNPMRFVASWKDRVYQPSTVEIISGRRSAAQTLEANLEPRSFAVFVTMSDGN